MLQHRSPFISVQPGWGSLGINGASHSGCDIHSSPDWTTGRGHEQRMISNGGCGIIEMLPSSSAIDQPDETQLYPETLPVSQVGVPYSGDQLRLDPDRCSG